MLTIVTVARSALIAAAVTLAGVSAAQAADSASGTIQLKGTVALSCTVAVSDLSPSLNLVSGESARPVGTVVETCNSGTGYTISLSSANAGQLTSSSNGTTPIGYSVSYDNQGGKLNNAMQVTRSSAQFGKSSTLAVSIDGNARAIAGNYADTITITIAAK